jgi:hypothetical protein
VKDYVAKQLSDLGLPRTRENWIANAWGGLAIEEWTPEHERELPEDLQDWSLFTYEDGQLTYTGPKIET